MLEWHTKDSFFYNFICGNGGQGTSENYTLYLSFLPGNKFSNRVSKAFTTTSILTFKCEAPISPANRLARPRVDSELHTIKDVNHLHWLTV